VIATGNRQQATGNRQQATGNRQQATGNRQQATGNRQLYSSSKEPCQLTNSEINSLYFPDKTPGLPIWADTGFFIFAGDETTRRFK